MQKMISHITKERKKELESELEDLQGPKRKAILETLKAARELGDLAENAEYHQAREDQGKLETRIQEVEAILRSAEIVPSKPDSDIVTFGSKVSIKREGDKEEREYTIVGSEEANMATGKVSNISPIGEALFGKKKGDKIAVKTPKGQMHYKITKVS